MADYGLEIYWKGQVQFKRQLQTLQNLALRKILGVFKTTPITPMEIESGILPADIRLDVSIRKYAFRTNLIGENHPVRTELERINLERRGEDPTTQMERIKQLRDRQPTDLEEVDPFLFPPWYETLPYTPRISSFDKTTEGRKHTVQVREAPDSRIAIYSDASALISGGNVGVGVVAYDYSQSKSKPVNTIARNLGTRNLVYNGEVEGLVQAINLAVRQGFQDKDIRIYADNQAAVQRLSTLSNKPEQSQLSTAIRSATVLVERGNRITLEWCPGHVNIEGNEEADLLAKKATLLPVLEPRTSISYYGSLIKAEGFKQWEERLKSAKDSPYKRTFGLAVGRRLKSPTKIREIASAFYQLKIGHGYFKSYLYRFNRSDNDRCQCSLTAAQTPRHLLLDCRLYRDLRVPLKDALKKYRPKLKDLFSTKLGTSLTVKFLE